MGEERDEEQLDGSEPRELAIPRLVEAEGGRLFALGMRFCGNREEAEDLVQETFLLAYRNWDQFQGRSRPSTWLYTIASRVCQRFHRKRSGEPDRIESIGELTAFDDSPMAVVRDEEEGPLEESVRHERRELVEQAISELPLGFRMPLVLKEIVGFSLHETALIMDLNENTVKTRLHRARLRLRNSLEGTLPRRDVPPPAYSKKVCLDLLQAKQETLDRNVPFEFPDDILCERCSEFFSTLDLARGICRELARGELPEDLRKELLAHLEAEL